MRPFLDEKRTIRTYVLFTSIVGVLFCAGYIIGFTSGIDYCATLGAKVLQKLGWHLSIPQFEEYVTKFLKQ